MKVGHIQSLLKLFSFETYKIPYENFDKIVP
jgi:hypothetical protein